MNECGLSIYASADEHNGLELSQGQIIVLIGPNGAGKSRLLETIAGLHDPGPMRISFGKEPLWAAEGKKRLNPAALLAYSYACQAPEEQLFARTVAAELEYVLRPYALAEAEKARRVEEALHAVGWDYNWLARDPYQMSGGERRRAALASLLATPSSWLLLDEPTSGLDASGHEVLAASLKGRAARGQGILLVSHESEWALPLAQQVLLMHADGSVHSRTREEILHRPDLLREAGMLVPEWLEIAHLLCKFGVSEEQIWHPAMQEAGKSSADGSDCHDQRDKDEIALTKPKPYYLPSRSGSSSSAGGVTDRSGKGTAISPLVAYDPRAVWLAYILFSTGILMQRTWIGLAWSGLLTAIIIVLARIPLRRWRIPIAMLAFVTVMMSVLAGVGAGANGMSWNMEAFLLSLRSLLRPWLAMLIGLGLPLAISPLKLRRSLEQLLAIRGRVPFRGQQLILAITLLLRFIPVLLSEWERFSRIALARGKAARLTWRGAVGRLRDTSIPFLLSLFRLGEEVAIALESRGVGRRPFPAVQHTQHWRYRDTLLVGSGLVICLLLWWLRS